MPEWMTPLLRVLVAMPSLGFCSTRKTSWERWETAWAMAQPITPPPMIRMLAWSMGVKRLPADDGVAKAKKKGLTQPRRVITKRGTAVINEIPTAKANAETQRTRRSAELIAYGGFVE